MVTSSTVLGFSSKDNCVSELRDEELLTDAEVALLLKIAKGTLKFWRCRPPRHKVPPAVRIGRTVRYRAGDIRRFMAELNAA